MAHSRPASLKTELRRFLRKHPETYSMELLLPDMHGILRSKRIRAKDFEKVCDDGFFFCGGTVLISALGEVFEGIPYGTSDGDPDVPASLVPVSIAPVPWSRKPMAQALFRLHDMQGFHTIDW